MKPKRLELQSQDGCQINIEALSQIAPSCITEAKDADGNLRKVVNFDVLRQLLGDAAADTGEEFYQFTWPGKAEARREAARPIKKTLRPVIEDSVDWDTTQNLYIEGDNLEVLKLLQKSYLGKVKMIYIDPPYNTGNDFVYDDDFSQSASDYAEASGDIDDLGNRYRKNTDSNGRFHSDWCSMIFPRLQIARTLLSEDGIIFISMDDNEIFNLQKIANDIFGENNFIALWKWNKTATPPALSYKVRGKYEYVLCYEKNRNLIKYNGGSVEGGDMPLLNETNPIGTLSFPLNSVVFNFDGYFLAGQYDRVELLNSITIIGGRADKDIVLKARFKWSQPNLDKEISEGTTFIIKTNKFAIRYAREGERVKRPSDIISKPECGVGTNEDAAKEISSLFESNIMSYPKPMTLIKYLIPFAEVNKNSLILDFFSGSATTAHAVMQLNAEDGGKRRFIMVQLPEETEENSEARKAGYANICEIGKERIRRAGKKVKEEARQNGQDLDIGFRVFRVDESNMADVYFQPKAYEQGKLDMMLDNVKADRTDLDLLFGAMLDWGVQLSLPMEKTEVKSRGTKVPIYVVNEGDLVACFAHDIDSDVIAAIADHSPLRILLRDSCFSSDADKINIFEQFKQLLNWSEEEAYKNIRVI